MFEMQTLSRQRIVVLAGGDSSERDVSLVSGGCVVEALQSRGHQCRLVDPARNPLIQVDWKQIDVCFNALHGGAGEDGTIQEQLRRLNVPYTGSGPTASRLAISKSASKERFTQVGVPTLPYMLLHDSESMSDVAARVGSLGYPLVIKPDSQGSSLGVTVSDHPGRLQHALVQGSLFESFLIAEPWVRGREFTVALLDRRPLPVIEIVPSGEMFDFQAKYQSDTTALRAENELPDQLCYRLAEVAHDAASSLGTRGLARVDMILDEFDCLWVLEVNTVPGLTRHSLAPMGAKQAGMDFATLCEWMLAGALAAEVRQ